MLVATFTTHAAASAWPGSSIQSSLSFETPSERVISQFSRPIAAGPWTLKMWLASRGAGVLFHIAVAITHAWTSAACAGAVFIKDCHGSDPAPLPYVRGLPQRRPGAA